MRLLPLALALAALAQATASASADGRNATPSPPQELVRVVLIGATGNLASKYLWVAAFRLALQAHLEHKQQYQFVAAASNTRTAGLEWQDAFFSHAFVLRVCGREGDAKDRASSTTNRQQQLVRAQCIAFFHDQFLPSIAYAPLRDEAQYQQLAASFAAELQDGASAARVEVGRLVYLAIPPAFFARASELAHTYLRPPQVAASASHPRPFFRVLVEKPFGVDLRSAQRLERRLRESLHPEEIYLVDHYAGKAVVQALRAYLGLNHVALAPWWSARSIRSITVRMTEDETLATRIEYFHSAGIIRDVMANHLHLLLGLVVSSTSPLADDRDVADYATRSLAFTHSLALGNDAQALVLGQYDAYAVHYAHATGQALDVNSTFVPTAARVQLTSSAEQWRDTAFVLEAAKAVHERRLEVVIVFDEARDDATRAATGSLPGRLDSSCELRATLQTRANDASERIAWSCRFFDGLDPPRGWQHDLHDTTDGATRPQSVVYRSMTPNRADSKTHWTPWTLGDAPSAYDALLFEAARGTRLHFASIDDALAAWTLWTPIVERAERAAEEQRLASSNGSTGVFIYPTGSASWYQVAVDAAPSSQRTLETELHDEL